MSLVDQVGAVDEELSDYIETLEEVTETPREEQRIESQLPAVSGTAADGHTKNRKRALADLAVRRFLAQVMVKHSWPKAARKLEELPPLEDRRSAHTAVAVCGAMADKVAFYGKDAQLERACNLAGEAAQAVAAGSEISVGEASAELAAAAGMKQEAIEMIEQLAEAPEEVLCETHTDRGPAGSGKGGV